MGKPQLPRPNHRSFIVCDGNNGVSASNLAWVYVEVKTGRGGIIAVGEGVLGVGIELNNAVGIRPNNLCFKSRLTVNDNLVAAHGTLSLNDVWIFNVDTLIVFEQAERLEFDISVLEAVAVNKRQRVASCMRNDVGVGRVQLSVLVEA